MEGEVIKSFLVGLGFSVDDASLAKFNKSITSAAVKVTALYASIQVAAAGIFHSIAGIASGFEEMGYSLRLVAPAVNKMLILRQAMLQTYAAAGINLVKVVKQSILFNYSLAKTKFALEAIYKSVGAKFLPLLTKQMDLFRQKIFQNMPKIQEILTKFVNIVFKAFGWTVQFGKRLWEVLERVYGFFKKLDEVTNGWSTKILLAIAAWRLLNLAFLATPLGLLLSFAAAIILLYDDLKTFKEGGNSLINWGSKTTEILIGILKWINPLHFEFIKWKFILTELIPWLERLGNSVSSWASKFGPVQLVLKLIGDRLSYIKGIIDGLLSSAGSKLAPLLSAIGGFFQQQGRDTLNTIAGVNNPAPLVPHGSGVNIKTQQQNNFNIQAGPTAHDTAHAVAGQLNNVNFDNTRNLTRAVGPGPSSGG